MDISPLGFSINPQDIGPELSSSETALLCEGTGCNNPAIGLHREVREVPAWRHPEDRPGQRMYEVLTSARYCADHKAVAKAPFRER
jgi:hypothetical protein